VFEEAGKNLVCPSRKEQTAEGEGKPALSHTGGRGGGLLGKKGPAQCTGTRNFRTEAPAQPGAWRRPPIPIRKEKKRDQLIRKGGEQKEFPIEKE